MQKTNIWTAKTLAFCAVSIAIALVLSNIKLFTMPQGGTVSPCSMFFITVTGFWFGPIVGIVSGAAYGLIQLAFGAYVIHPAQLIMDYILAFAALGLSGFFSGRKFGLYTGYIAGVCGRLLFSFLSGFIFFAEYAPEGQSPVIYSLIYNCSYIIPEMIITLVIISIPVFKSAIYRVNKPAI